jgi:hypothetical protein
MDVGQGRAGQGRIGQGRVELGRTDYFRIECYNTTTCILFKLTHKQYESTF